MAVIETTPVHHEKHYIERDSGTGSAFWAVLAVIIVLLALVLFGTRAFRGGTGNNTGGGGTNIEGNLNTPSGNYQGSGSVTPQ